MVIVEIDMLVDLGETAPQPGGRLSGRICPVEPLLIVPRRLAGGFPDAPRRLAGGCPDALWEQTGSLT